jgi:hypothetical protein
MPCCKELRSPTAAVVGTRKISFLISKECKKEGNNWTK